MKRKLLFASIISLALLIALAYLWEQDYGYVLINSGRWSLENSLSRFIVLFIPFMVASYVCIRLLIKIWHIPKSWSGFRQQRNIERARKDTLQGLIELLEGRWKVAEKTLLKNIEHSETKLLNYLTAARAAQQDGADERRDSHLKKAHEHTPEADIAIGLTQAELQLAHNQTEQALATLSRLRDIAPKHAYVLKLLTRLYTDLGEWEKILELLPEIRKRKIFVNDKLKELEKRTYSEFLVYIARSSAIYDIEERWRFFPKHYREDISVFKVYIDCLQKVDKPSSAEQAIRNFLNKQWDESLVYTYALINVPQPEKQLEYAETWLKDHGRSPMLLLTLGRLCYRLRLWGKARVYFETSIAIKPCMESYQELAYLLETLGDKEAAYDCWRKGLELATKKPSSTNNSNEETANTNTFTPSQENKKSA